MRVKQVRISPEMVTSFFISGWGLTHPIELISDGLPIDSILCGAGLNKDGELILRFYHPSFQDVQESQEPETITPVYQTPPPEVPREP